MNAFAPIKPHWGESVAVPPRATPTRLGTLEDERLSDVRFWAVRQRTVDFAVDHLSAPVDDVEGFYRLTVVEFAGTPGDEYAPDVVLLLY